MDTEKEIIPRLHLNACLMYFLERNWIETSANKLGKNKINLRITFCFKILKNKNYNRSTFQWSWMHCQIKVDTEGNSLFYWTTYITSRASRLLEILFRLLGEQNALDTPMNLLLLLFGNLCTQCTLSSNAAVYTSFYL